MGPDRPDLRLERLVLAYVDICHHRARSSNAELSRLVHSPFELEAAEKQVVDLFARAIDEGRTARGTPVCERTGRLRRTSVDSCL